MSRLLRRRVRWLYAVTALSLLPHAAATAKDAADYLQQADRYLAEGNLKAAEIELKNAVRAAPLDAHTHARLAYVFLQLRDFPAAERQAIAAHERGASEQDYLAILAEALLGQQKFGAVASLVRPGEREPRLESTIRTDLAIAASALRDPDRAEALARDAIRLDPAAAQPKLLLAKLINAKSPQEADKLVDQVIAADPHSLSGLYVKAELLQAREDHDGARRAFDAVLEIDPGFLPARLGRAATLIAQDKFAAADADLDPVLRTDPNQVTANYLRALELAKTGRFEEADRICERISAGFAWLPQGYYLKGAVKFALGRFQQAEVTLRDYADHAPDDARAVRLMARAALAQHAAPRAIDYLKTLTGRSSPEPATLALLGDAYMANGRPELAMQQYEKAAAAEPANLRVTTGIAVSRIDAGQGAYGLSELEQVVAKGPSGEAIAGPSLVLSALNAGHIDKAAAVAAGLIKQDPDNPLYLRLLGAVRAAQHDDAGAETALRAALSRDPSLSAAARDLAQLYLAGGRIDAARKVYNDLLSHDAHDMVGLLGLADVAVAEDNLAKAKELLASASAAVPDNPAPSLRLFELYAQRQEWEGAKAVANELITRFPRNLDVVEALAEAQLGVGDLAGAIASYKRAYEIAPESKRVLDRYVTLLYRAKDFSRARTLLRNAVLADPNDRSLKVELIRADAKVDGIEMALSHARAFAKNDPATSRYERVAADLLEAAGRPGEAKNLLQSASAARPADADLAAALAGMLQRTGAFAEAKALLDKRLAADPKDPKLRGALAAFYLTIGRPGDAKKVYRQLLADDPDDADALLALANIAIAEKSWGEAAAELARARTAAPGDPMPGVDLVNFHAFRRDWKSAAAAAAELVRAFPTHPDLLDLQAKVQMAAGDVPGAIVTSRRAYQLDQDSQAALSRHLGALEAAKDYRAAQSVLAIAFARDPNSPFLKAEMVRVEAKIGGIEAGVARARDFAKYDPSNSLYDVLIADLYESAGRADTARNVLEKAVARHPADAGLLIALAQSYRRGGDPAKAEAVLRDRLAADPKNDRIRAALAGFYLDQQQYAAAIAAYGEVIAVRPTDIPALNNLAWLYQQTGELAKARTLAEQAFALAPRAPETNDTLGWIMVSQGEAREAVTYLGAAAAMAPHNPDVQYHLAVALDRIGRAGEARTVLEDLLGSGAPFSDKANAQELLRHLQQG